MEENDENIFAKVEYECEKYRVTGALVGTIIFSALLIYSFTVGNNPPSTIIIALIIICIMLAIALVRIKYVNRHKKWLSYMQENGNLFRGKIRKIVLNKNIRLLKSILLDRRWYHYNNKYYNIKIHDYYYEIEYYDSYKNKTEIFTTPKLYDMPIEEYTTCEVYVVDELPRQFKKLKEASRAIAINFN